jgi:hypothetical protein
MQYDIHTNKTTPYWNCPTYTLKQKVNSITEMIVKVNSIPGNHLDCIEATRLTQMLIELRRSVTNQIAYREEN